MTEIKKPAVKKTVAKKTALPDLYELLSVKIPKEYLMSYSEGTKTFTGYHAQYAIDLLNSNVGLGNWFTVEKIYKQEMVGKAWFVSMGLEIQINYGEKEIAVTGYGAGFASKGVNAYKSAKTSAFKNACRYLGIGRELYIQGFEDDIPTDKGRMESNDDKVITEVSDTGAINKSEEIIKRINNTQTQADIENMRNEVTMFETGDAVKKIILKKFNDRLVFFNEQNDGNIKSIK